VQTFYEDESEASLVQATAAASSQKEEKEEEREEPGKVFPMEELTAITKDTGGQLSKTLIHLVMADMAYVEKGQPINLNLPADRFFCLGFSC